MPVTSPPKLDAMVCDLIGAFLDDLAAGENPGVVSNSETPL